MLYNLYDKVNYITLSAICIIFFLSGCTDIKDMSTNALSADENQTLSKKSVNQFSQLTGVVFTEGTAGKNYIYYGSGIDDALSIKVSLPADKKEEFLRNTVFTSGEKKEPYIHIGGDKNWWKLESLADPAYTIYNFPNGSMVE